MEIINQQQLDDLTKLVEAELLAIRQESDRRAAVENKHKKLLLAGMAATMLFAAASVGLNYYLFPLKQTQPIIAVVDGQTGIVTEVIYAEKDSDPKQIETLAKSYAYSYVVTRYSYNLDAGGNPQSLRDRYRRVSLFSGDTVNKEFLGEVSPNNPNSPYSLLGETGTIDVKITAITLLPEDRIQVDFRTILKQSQTEKIFAYTAIGKYVTNNFDGLSVQDQWINPFGFKFETWSISQKASNDALAPVQAGVGLPAVEPSQLITNGETSAPAEPGQEQTQ